MEPVNGPPAPSPTPVSHDTGVYETGSGHDTVTNGIHTVDGTSRPTGINVWDQKIEGHTATLRDEFNKQIILSGIQQMQPLIEKMKEALRETEG